MPQDRSSLDISVVLCTFNGDTFLKEQINSIFSQTLLPTEIVISDDGSSDSTLALIDSLKREYGEHDVRWVVKKRKNPIGPAQNFWSVIPHASCELIALADQDDVWYPTKLERLAQYFLRNPDVLLVHSDADIVDANGTVKGGLFDSLRITLRESRLLRENRGLGALVRRNLVTGMTVMIRKSLFLLADPLPPGWVHDEWLAFIAAAHGGLRTEPSKLGAYRQHGLNSIGAEKISAKSATKRLFLSREPYLAHKTERAQHFEKFLEEKGEGISSDSRKLVRGKISFLRWQAALPHSRLIRVPAVFFRLIAGTYRRFARGLFDAIRDVVMR